jgi:hypothetical protein
MGASAARAGDKEMPAKLTPEEWKKVGELYVANIPVLRISKQFGVARISIERAAKRFGWVKIPREDIEEVVQAKVHGGHLSTDPQAKAEFIGKVADERARLVGRHKEDWGKVYSLRADAYAVLAGQRTQVITMDYETATKLEMKDRINLAGKLIAMFEADARALNTAQEGERRANGMDYKAQAESKQVDEVEARERKALIASLVNLSQTYHARIQAKEAEGA